MKLGAVVFVVAAPTTYVVNFQLAGGIWMLQVLPPVFLALYIPSLDARAVLAGWVIGIAFGPGRWRWSISEPPATRIRFSATTGPFT